MSRKKNDKQEGGFVKLLAWTVVLALVFSAGLITGQRLLRAEAQAPMVSLSSSRIAKQATEKGAEAASLRTTFSFYEHLTGVTPSVSAQEAPVPKAGKPEAKKAADEKPEVKVEEKPAEQPAVKPAPQPEEKAEAPVAPAEKAEAAPAEEPPAAQPAEKATAPEPEKSESSEPTKILAKVVDSIRGDDAPEALPAHYTLQVSSHPDRELAEREMDRLRGVGVEPHVVVVEVPGKGKLWRIRVGKFHAMDEARAFQATLKQKRGVPGFVTPL